MAICLLALGKYAATAAVAAYFPIADKRPAADALCIQFEMIDFLQCSYSLCKKVQIARSTSQSENMHQVPIDTMSLTQALLPLGL